MKSITFKRCVLSVGFAYSMLMSICFCRSEDEQLMSFDRLWPEGRVAEILRLSKRLVSCAHLLQGEELTAHERARQMRELARLTEEFGKRVRMLDYEQLKEDEYLYIYTIARQALMLYKALQEPS